MKEIIGSVIYYTGLPAFYRSCFAKRNQNFKVLAYHHIADDNVLPDPFLKISGVTRLSVFKKQIKYILKHCKVISIEKLVRHFEYGEKLPTNSILLTFDDGYYSVYKYAYPVLKHYELPGVVFCTGDELSGNGLWCDKLLDALLKTNVKIFRYKNHFFKLSNMKTRGQVFLAMVNILNKKGANKIQKELNNIFGILGVEYQNDNKRYLTKNQILEMQSNNISFGAHSMTHTLLGLIDKRNDVKWEIKRSIHLLEEITKRKCTSFAYPFGGSRSTSELCIEVLKELEIKLAFTTMRGANIPGCNRYLLRRFIVQRDSKYYFRLQLSGLIYG
jgi:peptidoglycan/xylan/chitin deacetylase (PgdA/CDA1 family)